MWKNKLQRLAFSDNPMFEKLARAYLSHIRLSILHINIGQGWKVFPKANTQVDFSRELGDKIFLTLTPGAKHIKHYHGNLPSFHGNTIILCYKAVLPW
jgi:hypothetical protein